MDDQRTLEDIHPDVDFANRYRLECIKHMMSLSAGIFVISMAFMRDIIGPGKAHHTGLLLVGWLALTASLTAGIFHLKCWDRFYISYRKPRDEGDRRRTRINRWRKLCEACQILFFVLGLLAILGFASINVS